jgi:hypothetical protein
MDIQAVLTEHQVFAQRVESAKGLPLLPEGFQFQTLELLVDGFSFFYVKDDRQLEIPFDPKEEWSTLELLLDDQLVFATIKGLESPLIDRAPGFFEYEV